MKDQNLFSKMIRFFKIWFLLAALTALLVLIHAILDRPKALAQDLSLGSIIEALQCVRTIEGLRWNSNQEPGLAYYNVYRGEIKKKGLDWKFLGNTSHTTETTIKFKLGKSDKKALYFYRVTAVTERGIEGPPSEPISCLNN